MIINDNFDLINGTYTFSGVDKNSSTIRYISRKSKDVVLYECDTCNAVGIKFEQLTITQSNVLSYWDDTGNTKFLQLLGQYNSSFLHLEDVNMYDIFLRQNNVTGFPKSGMDMRGKVISGSEYSNSFDYVLFENIHLKSIDDSQTWT